MLTRIKKAILTKRIHKYQRYGKRVLKIEILNGANLYSKEDAHFYACLTPGSENVYVNHITPSIGPVGMSVTAFSDFIVRTDKFDYIIGVVENNLQEILDVKSDT